MSKYKNIMIPEGSVEELWDIFDRVFEELDEHDEILFDITHAYRSLPMLAIIILNYARCLKNVELLGIYYGAFERLGSPRDVLNMPPEDRNAPVFDLTSFVTLMDWTVEVDRFLRDGDTEGIGKLSETIAKNILRETKGRNEDARSLRKFSDSLKEFSEHILTCRGNVLPLSIKKVMGNLNTAEKATENLAKPMGKLLDKIRDKFSRFEDKDDILLIHQSARWCCEHGLVQQGLTLFQENLVSYVAVKNNLPLDDLLAREYISRILAAEGSKKAFSFKREEEFVGKYGVRRRDILNTMDNSISVIYNFISDYRNDINHAGFRTGSHRGKDFSESLFKVLEEFEAIVYK